MDEFSQDFEILTILTSELKLATLNELQTVYTVSDAYDLLEIIDVQQTLMSEEQKKNEQIQKKNNK